MSLVVQGAAATHLRPAVAADAPFCQVLFYEQRRSQFVPLGLSDVLLAHLLDGQNRAQLASFSRHHPQAKTLIVVHENVPVGSVVVVLDRTDLEGVRCICWTLP